MNCPEQPIYRLKIGPGPPGAGAEGVSGAERNGMKPDRGGWWLHNSEWAENHSLANGKVNCAVSELQLKKAVT